MNISFCLARREYNSKWAYRRGPQAINGRNHFAFVYFFLAQAKQMQALPLAKSGTRCSNSRGKVTPGLLHQQSAGLSAQPAIAHALDSPQSGHDLGSTVVTSLNGLLGFNLKIVNTKKLKRAITNNMNAITCYRMIEIKACRVQH